MKSGMKLLTTMIIFVIFKTVIIVLFADLTQLTNLDPKGVSNLMPKLFTKAECNDNVIGKNAAPWIDRKWIELLWQYLNNHFNTTLSLLEGLHVVPLDSDCTRMLRLDKRLAVISRMNASGSTLPKDLATICDELGIYVIDDLLPELYKHPQFVNSYAFQPTAEGLLQVMSRLPRGHVAKGLLQCTDKVRLCLRNFLAKDINQSSLSESDKQLLQILPIFTTVDGSGREKARLVALTEVNTAAPSSREGKMPVPSPVVLLNLDDENSRRLAEICNVKQKSLAIIVAEVYFHGLKNGWYSTDEMMTFMKYFCENLKRFQQNYYNIENCGKEIRFVQKADGTCVRPCDVFDNGEKVLAQLFSTQTAFPTGEFAKPKYREALKAMGLKNSLSVTATEMHNIAVTLSSDNLSAGEKKTVADAFCQLLNRRSELFVQSLGGLPSVTLRDKLIDLPCIPIMCKRVDSRSYPQSLPFYNENVSNGFATPAQVKAVKYANLIGSVRPLVDSQGLAVLATTYGWNDEPNIEDVKQHLTNVVECYSCEQKVQFLNIVCSIYRFVNEHKHCLKSFVIAMADRKWIWNGESFSDPSQVVLGKDSLELKPYRFTLPRELSEFRDLWTECGLKRESDLTEVLQAVSDRHERENDLEQMAVDHDIQLCVNILNSLAKQKHGQDEQFLLIPVNTKTGKLQMKPATECTYIDKEWYQHDFDIEDLNADVFLIHELVPTKTAEQLNIPSLISRTLGVVELDVGFGQSEPLTRRLNAILRDYTDGLAVLKELIQNADDAGASEICFLYDERYNEDARHILLDQGMKELQGPALWTYNNAVFADSDFANIVKLSGATKEKDGQKIGRFGLGFNAVYHLTDVPSFISRGNIVFFDPHTKYLGRAVTNKGKPGIKLNLDTHQHKIQRLTDQFKPYNDIFGCNLSKDSTMKSYEGTLFRFPLRTEEQASKSDISKQHYSDTEMMKLLSLLETAAHHVLLYTQNVRLIKVFHLTATATSAQEMTLWFSVERDLVKEMRNVTSSKNTLPGDAGKFTPRNTLPYNILQQCCLLMKNYKKDRLKNSYFCEFSAIYNIMVKYGNAAHTKFAGKASTDSESYWLVVSCSGRNRLLELACQDSSLIPVGGVAAQLERTDDSSFKAVDIQFGLHSVGMVYCFLPLPVQFNLPVHVNGFFAIHSSRTHLHERVAMDKEDKRAVWNEALMSDAVCQAYCILLEDLTKCSNTSSYNIWPVAKSLKEIAHLAVHLYQSLYHRICTDENCAVIKGDEGWVSLNRCILLNPEFRKDEIAQLALHVLKMTANRTNTVIDIPEDVVETMLEVQSCKTVMQQKFIDKPTFFKHWFFPNIRKIDPLTRDKLVLNCLFDDKLKHLLTGIECIPVSPDGKDLKTISELVHPNCKLAELYDADEGWFPLWKSGVTDDDEKRRCIHDALVKLGMKKNDLSWEEIADRCMVIQSNPSTATTRTKIVISLMSSNLTKKMSHSQHILESIRRTKFLPVMKPPPNFPVRWKGDDSVLVSSKEGYLADKKHLVCCSYPVIDQKCFDAGYKDVKKMLGLLDKEVEITTAVNQICELQNAAAMNVVQHQQCMDQFNQVYHDVFTFLNTLAERPKNHEKTVLSKLSSTKCVLVYKTMLMLPSRCAMTSTHRLLSLLPYLAVIPPNAATQYGHVLKAIGVKDDFALTDYVWILHEMQNQSQGRELNSDEMELVIYVINQCVDAECRKSNAVTTSMDDLPVPNAANCLCPARSLCYNNCPWLMTPDDINFCNPNITYPATESIGIKTVRQDIMKRHKLVLPFGQKERLVKRIKRIVESYPFSDDILKEMLQNADDAGATTIHFICDLRSLGTEKVFDETWKAVQGPAVCIYNDRSFTNKDLQGIQSLGEGSKSDDPVKTGQYGVGFNCVYHLTDVPTFFTTVEGQGTVLCAFDPNCKYVPGADDHNPGGMFQVTDDLQTNFCDVFSGYFTKQYDISKNGTLFRLPLRTEDMARGSEILQTAVTVKDIKSLFTSFRLDMYESLLFVNSVEEICLREVTPGYADVINFQDVYSVHVRLTEDAKAQRNFLQSKMWKAALKLRKKGKKLHEVEMTEVVYELTTEDSHEHRDIWQIVQRCGFEDSSVIPKIVSDACQCGDLGLLPLGGVAYLKQSSSAGRQPTAKANRLFCFLPLPVKLPELPVHVNGHFVLSNENRRGLWTDEHKSFKSEWNRCIMEGVVAPAYCTLIRTLKDSLRAGNSDCNSFDEAKRRINKFHSVFPKISKTDASPYETNLTTAVYKYIGTENLDVLPLLSSAKQLQNVKWMGPLGQPNKKVYFDDLDNQILASETRSQQTMFRSSGAIGIHTPETDHEQSKPHLLIKQALMRCGFLLFACPIHLCKNFEKAKVPVERIKPEALLDFFASYNQHAAQCKLGNVPSKLSDTALKEMKFILALLKYCCKVTDYKQRLVSLPLLVTKSLLLTTFSSQDRKYVTDYSDVAPNVPDMFMHPDIFKVLQLHPKEDVHLCKQFDVAEFSKLLPGMLCRGDYYGAEKTVDIRKLKELLRENNYDTSWLARLWSFFASFVTHSPLAVQPDQAKPDEANTATVLMPVIDWCLLPVTCGHGELLFPVRQSCAVLSLRDETSSEFVDILKALGVAEVNWKYIDRTLHVSHFMSSLLGSIHQPQCIVLALKNLLQQNTLTGALSTDKGLRLLAYFSDNVTALRDDDETKNIISQLPFFVSLFETQISINRASTYVLSTVPGDDMQIWREELNITFLMQKPSIEKLVVYLGCKRLTVVEAYTTFILPHFNKLSRAGQEVHIGFVRNHLRQLKPFDDLSLSTCNKRTKSEITTLTKALKSLAFLPSQQADNHLVTAADYYDIHHEVFKAMLPESKFPPDPYCSWAWREFLLDCGIIHKVTEEMFIEFATDVQNKATEEVTDAVCQQSKILLTHFLERNDLQSPSFLDTVKSISFVQPDEVSKHLEHLHPQHGIRNHVTDRLQFIHLQHSVLSCNKELIWTVKNILPQCVSEHALKTDRDQHHKFVNMMQQLQVIVEVTPEDVAQHAKQLCTHVTNEASHNLNNETTAQTLEVALKSVYTFLNKHSPLQPSVVSILTDTPLIYVRDSCKLIRPAHFATNILDEQELTPYLNKLPLTIGEFVNLFMQLGTTKIPTVCQYAGVLEAIHDKAEEQKLLPDESKFVTMALRSMFELMTNDRGAQLTIPERIYLPSRSDKLLLSSDLIYVDHGSLLGRLRRLQKPLLVDLKLLCNFTTEEDVKKVWQKLPDVQQPTWLSSMVKEYLVEGCDDIDSDIANELRNRLTSAEFRTGVQRLARHCLAEKSLTPDDMNLAIQNICSQMQRIRIIGKSEIKTYLEYDGERIPNSEKPLPFFNESITEDGSSVQQIYVQRSPGYLASFHVHVANVINKAAENHLLLVLDKLTLIIGCQLQEIDELLNDHEIIGLKTTIKQFNAPLGSLVAEHKHCYLVQNVFSFEIGMLVALELDDPLDRGERGGAKYKLVEVLERLHIDSESTMADRYRVKVSTDGEEQIVDASLLYAFSRDRVPRDVFEQEGDEDDRDNMIVLRPPGSTGGAASEPEMPTDFRGIINELKRQLKEAWTLPEEQRRKIVKRLYLQWHPDKHPSKKNNLMTKVFQMLQKLLEMLKESKPIDDVDEDEAAGASTRNADDDFMGERARNYRHYWEQQYNSYSHNFGRPRHGRFTSSSYHDQYADFFSDFRPPPSPEPAEAERWMRQAKYDLEAANNDEVPEWACYQCYQVKLALHRDSKNSTRKGGTRGHTVHFTAGVTNLQFPILVCFFPRCLIFS